MVSLGKEHGEDSPGKKIIQLGATAEQEALERFYGQTKGAELAPPKHKYSDIIIRLYTGHIIDWAEVKVDTYPDAIGVEFIQEVAGEARIGSLFHSVAPLWDIKTQYGWFRMYRKAVEILACRYAHDYRYCWHNMAVSGIPTVIVRVPVRELQANCYEFKPLLKEDKTKWRKSKKK